MNFGELLQWGAARAVHASWQAGFLILLVLGLQRVLRRRLSPGWRHALWVPVLLRLALPATPPAPFSLFQGLPFRVTASAGATGDGTSGRSVRAFESEGRHAPGYAHDRRSSLVVEPKGDGSFPTREAGAATPADRGHRDFEAPPDTGRTVSGEAAAVPSLVAVREARSGGARVGWGLIWGVGVCVWLAYAAAGLVWLRLRVRGYRPVTEPEVLRSWEACRVEMRVRARVRLVEADEACGPALLGWGGYWLLLPRGFASRFGGDELRHVFLHELAHLRRGDLVVSAVMVVLQGLHWFNPLVWIALGRVRAAREEAADALALRHVGSDAPRNYGMTILRMVEESVSARYRLGRVGILDEPKQLAERIEAIARFRAGASDRRWPLGLCLTLALVGLTDARPTGAPASAISAGAGGAGRGASATNSTNLGRPGPGPGEGTKRALAGEAEGSVTVGGVVRDEVGRPVKGIAIEVIGHGARRGLAERWSSGARGIVVATESDGRWRLDGVPEFLDEFEVDCVRPDGMVHRFGTRKPQAENDWYHGGRGAERGAPIDLAAFRKREAVLVLPEGRALRGRVVDPEGRPVGGVRVRAAFGHERRSMAGEARTDATGRFVFAHRTPIEWILTAAAPGYAISSTVVAMDAAAEGAESEIRLGRAGPLRVRVEDEFGKPRAGANVSVDSRRSGPQILDFAGATDGDGRLTWAEAPRAALALRVSSFAPGTERVVRLGAEDRDVVVRLRSGVRTNIVVTGRAVEQGTGRPMEVATVAFRASTSSEFSTVALETLTLPGDGGFRLGIPVDWFHQDVERRFQLRLWAPGVGRVVTAWRDFDEGDWETTVSYRRGGTLQGRVRLPDGRPASDAVLRYSEGALKPVSVRFDPRARDPWALDPERDLTAGVADSEGRYGIDDPGEDGSILVLHREGFLEIEAKRMREHPDVTLKPLGRIEGVLRSEGRPVPGQRVSLRRDNYGRFDRSWYLILGAETAADGSFAFDWVPPGDLVLNRWIPTAGGAGFAESHSQRVHVEPGATVRVTYGGDGRRVEGRIVGRNPETESNGLRWVAKRRFAMPAIPDPDDYATSESYSKSLRRFSGLNAYWAQYRTYGIEVGSDGRFRVEDVPPGTYVMEWSSRASPEEPEISPSEPRTWRREFEVPAATPGNSSAALNLGVLDWETNGATRAKSEAVP